MKLPPRRILRSILEDAISDRREFEDANRRDAAVLAETGALVATYKAMRPRLADDAPPLTAADHDLLATACMHARIWREGLVDSWRRTGDKAILLEARQDVARVARTEKALGVRCGPDPGEDAELVSIFDLMRRKDAFRDLSDQAA